MALALFACSVYDAELTSHQAAEGGSPSAEGGQPGSGATDTGGTDSAGAGASLPSAGTSTSGGVSGTSGSGATGATGNTGATDAGGAPAAGAGGAATGAMDAGGAGGAPEPPDNCPADPAKLEPGSCGCGVPDPPSATKADCQTLKSLLVHRYDFEGTGTSVKDRVGTAHGTIASGATLSKLDGKGVVLLGGGTNGPYVDLPNGIVKALTDASIEAWVTWGGGTSWQRIFDFGDSDASTPENNPANGKSYLMVTPKAGSTSTVFAAFSLSGVPGETQVSGTAVLEQSLSQVVLVANDTADLLTLFVNGVKVAEQAWTGQLAQLNDVNAWLGRSQYVYDAKFTGVYHEFRIYSAALSAAQVAAAYNGGTDPAYLAY